MLTSFMLRHFNLSVQKSPVNLIKLYKPFKLEPDYINLEISRNKSLQLTLRDQTFDIHDASFFHPLRKPLVI